MININNNAAYVCQVVIIKINSGCLRKIQHVIVFALGEFLLRSKREDHEAVEETYIIHVK